ncbi:MAG: hypothetical protein F7C34_02835 [Desulfurococcales archaeon]|nr:hypothetical protein [Desulfurococcales archaeon]
MGQRVVLRFSVRRSGLSRPAEYLYVYYGGRRVFSARCPRPLVERLLEEYDGFVARSRSGRTLYLVGRMAESVARRVIVLAAIASCTRDPTRLLGAVHAVAAMSELETMLWASKILEQHEQSGHQGVCRAARAIKTLHSLD